MHYPYLRILYLRALSRGATEEDLIARAAAVESNSEHFLAKAIVAAAGHRNLTRLAVTNFEALAGRGAKALVCIRTK
jgi:cation transport ATPase